MLKPQDALVACKVFSLGDEPWSYRQLAGSLFLSLGETHDSVARCLDAGLVVRRRGHSKIEAARRRVFDLCSVALPTFCYPARGRVVRGVPTSVHASCLADLFPPAVSSPLAVWPCEDGDQVVRGEGLLPVYPTVPRATRHDPLLHKLLALVDVVRVGTPAERRSAMEMLKETVVGDGRRR